MGAIGDDDSRTMALFRAEYRWDERDCDEMVEAKFAAYAQNLDYLEQRRTHFLVQSLAPLLGFKLGAG